ncbi:putative retrovirus polyprotein [Sclerotinia borealis F-4128]|uniref:Putative retrovirus polyprotein n=1 Tax=Sclerotinia borealis (strain F-4128) TaxID=1432307 RepID=W9CA71_SCLBF|nr:putative retrovirus polyprotein [Sclerotinia borealis F-4128]
MEYQVRKLQIKEEGNAKEQKALNMKLEVIMLAIGRLDAKQARSSTRFGCRQRGGRYASDSDKGYSGNQPPPPPPRTGKTAGGGHQHRHGRGRTLRKYQTRINLMMVTKEELISRVGVLGDDAIHLLRTKGHAQKFLHPRFDQGHEQFINSTEILDCLQDIFINPGKQRDTDAEFQQLRMRTAEVYHTFLNDFVGNPFVIDVAFPQILETNRERLAYQARQAKVNRKLEPARGADRPMGSHPQEETPMGKKRKDEDIICYICGEKGHCSPQCPKPKRKADVNELAEDSSEKQSVDGSINCEALADSGAGGFCFIDTTCAYDVGKYLGLKIQRLPEVFRPHGFNGKKADAITDYIRIHMLLDGRRILGLVPVPVNVEHQRDVDDREINVKREEITTGLSKSILKRGQAVFKVDEASEAKSDSSSEGERSDPAVPGTMWAEASALAPYICIGPEKSVGASGAGAKGPAYLNRSGGRDGRQYNREHGKNEIFSLSINDIDRKIEDRESEAKIKKKLPSKYRTEANVFSKKESRNLPQHRAYDHKIELTSPEEELSYSPLQRYTKEELRSMKQYIVDNLDKGFIKTSKAPFAAPVLFVRKPSGVAVLHRLPEAQLNHSTRSVPPATHR